MYELRFMVGPRGVRLGPFGLTRDLIPDAGDVNPRLDARDNKDCGHEETKTRIQETSFMVITDKIFKF